MIRIRNKEIVIFEGETLDLVYSQLQEPYWLIVSNDPMYKNFGFSKEASVYVKKLKVNKYYDYNAFRISTYCNYKGDLYYLENIKNETVILSPEIKTKQKLGIHIYDDRRIELSYEKFINEVEEIWEERSAIEGFRFEVEPIFFIKKTE
ncbi:hypothetical protein HX109_08625 [Galbibacter sp. BG1]|uniref:hypothetical protein n=1 Tax=Galbibacter sp. BG1 TaxID=1170699 RepID=UPI0015BE7A40|nr:hypothetical protein [Galbibacter sp. BG1]QLE01628.1 hypothetical protein HX109_08625 [Galbibacter sp. BG1]